MFEEDQNQEEQKDYLIPLTIASALIGLYIGSLIAGVVIWALGYMILEENNKL